MASVRNTLSRSARLAVAGATKRSVGFTAFGRIAPSARACASPVAGPSRLRSYATASSGASSVHDPTNERVDELHEQAYRQQEVGDVEGAKRSYLKSLEIKPTSEAWYNLGICEYNLKRPSEAIAAWEKSVELSPSADAYTNLASAYILGRPPQPALAIKHLTKAHELDPNDPEIAFNLGAVLESTNKLEVALQMYKKALAGGVDRADQNIRNVSAKLLGMKAQAAEAAGKAGQS